VVLDKPVSYSTLLDSLLLVVSRCARRCRPCPAMAVAGLGGGRHFAGARVLLVEDNPINAEVAAELLSSVGLQVRHAESGAAALAQVEQACRGGPIWC
jgi:PleD family two-component response regulator